MGNGNQLHGEFASFDIGTAAIGLLQLRLDPGVVAGGVFIEVALGEPLVVAVQIYNQFHVVAPCINSAIASSSLNDFELIVIDDGSTEQQLLKYLQYESNRGNITLLRNDSNMGFTRTVNRGMQLNPDRDVVLLNSDTLVYGDWAARLGATALSGADIATVNPLTNGSHISGYPHRISSKNMNIGLDYLELDNLAKERNSGASAYVHATVGFCMYIRRKCIESIGLFDDKHFPAGYGEESDFCARARKAGWRHKIDGGVHVAHLENQSFGDRKRLLMERMSRKITELHPDYARYDKHFDVTDPVRPLRTGLDLARLRRLLAGKRELTVQSIDRRATAAAQGPSLAYRPLDQTLSFAVDEGLHLPNLPRYILPRDMLRLNSDMEYLGVERLGCATPAELARLQATVAPRSMETGLRPQLVIQPQQSADRMRSG